MTDSAAPPATSFTRLFLKGFSWSFVQSVGGLLVQVGTLAILSRLLTPLDFGVVAVAISAIGVVSLVVELGVGPALIQHRALNHRHIGSAIWLSIVLVSTLMVVCQIVAAPVAKWLGIADQVNVVRFLCLIVALQPFTTIVTSLAKRDLDMKAIAAANLAAGIIGYSAIAISLAVLGYGVWALAIAQISQLLITLLMLLFSQFHKVSFRVGRVETRDILSFGLFFSIGRLANYAAQKFDRALVGMFLGIAAAGNYQRVLNMLQLIGPLAAGPLDAILFPLLSKIQDDAGRLRRSYRATTSIAAILTMPASVLMCITAPVLVTVILGPQWDDVILPAQIMAGMLFFRTNDSITATLVRAVGRVKERAALQVLYAILSLSSIYLLKDFGLVGIAYGQLGVTILNFILMSFLVRRIAQMTIGDNFFPLLPGVLIGGSLVASAIPFYLTTHRAFFEISWTGLYLLASAIISVALIIFLPGGCFPSEVAAMRTTLLRGAVYHLWPKRTSTTSLRSIGG